MAGLFEERGPDRSDDGQAGDWLAAPLIANLRLGRPVLVVLRMLSSLGSHPIRRATQARASDLATAQLLDPSHRVWP